MARLTKEQRADVRQYAQQLVSRGVSRRKMDTALREYSFEKYGIRQSIGKTAHSRLFQQRVAEIAEQEAETSRGYVSPRKKYQIRYNKLVRNHFLPEEAKVLLSRLNRIDTNEIRGMLEQRKVLHDRFLRKAAEENYSPTQMRRKWHKAVRQFYVNNRNTWVKDWLVFHRKKGDRIKRGKKMGFNAIWDWYGFIKGKLPESEQYDTPRKHRRKSQKPLTPKKIKDARKLSNLQALIDKETDPSMRAWYRELMKKYGG